MIPDAHLTLDELARRSGRPPEALIEEALPDLPIKTHGLLRRAGVHTLADLLKLGETGRADLRGFGPRSLALVKAALLRSGPAVVFPEDAIGVLRGLLDKQELFTRPGSDRYTLDVRHHRPGDVQVGPTTRVTAHDTPEGTRFEVTPPPLPGRESGKPFTTLYAHEAVAQIRAQTLYPYECLMDCGNPAGVPCSPSCQSWPVDRYTPLPHPKTENALGAAPVDEPPFPDDDSAARAPQTPASDGPA
ncbi:unnamed protein product [[Actinomadura] parvosata subsp. kistnae]|uniref:RNA polymerase alpha subunit C-terminal domain-containing protein n=1 Tax=[Actinomadura] parvosata subsp. kistnae TaxID=1909395 RepID=A0A1U9ZXX9_9ACTN|nr:hypothetical protein [Nonomuraea sp. ATCC 55076]AQZ62790.1 hypothetical protein BKM31_16170 [Nonomuraea sp. ATCC 55076]SPL98312.1 unnamed protein product [Actinomadura parvosata subsp. kistnae]